MLDTEPNDTPETSGTPGAASPGTSDNDHTTNDDTATTPAPRRRRRAASRPAGPPSVASPEAAPVTAAVTTEEPAEQVAGDEEPEADEAEAIVEPAPEPEAPRRARRTRKRVTAPVTDTADAAPVEAPATSETEAAPVEAAPEEEAPRRVRRTRKRAATAPEEATPEAAAPAEPVAQAPAAEAEPAEETPRRARRTRKRAVPAAEDREAGAESTPEPTPAAGPIARAEPEPEAESAAEVAPKSRRTSPPPVFQPLFQAPQAVFAAPQRAVEPAPAPTTPAAPTAPATSPAAESASEDRAEPDEPRSRRRRRRALPVDETHSAAEAEPQDSRYQNEQERPAADEAQADADVEDDAEGADAHDDDHEGERPTRRRRRGGRRRRGRGDDDRAEDNGSDEDTAERAAGAEDEQSDAHEDDEDHDDSGDAGATTSSRRRRRRRRRDGVSDEPDQPQDDPERTVVKVREPRKREIPRETETPHDEVQSVKGSTRLEAKKQRRREGREQGRRRVPIITESEFLARREAVERVMVVRENGERTQIGVLEDDVLVEHYVSHRTDNHSYVGNVYLGKVQNVLPSMEAAFVDIGKGRNAVLYAGEVNFEAAGFSGPRRIEAVLKPGQSVLVQVTKDPIGHKGARLTSQVSLPGRYLVYVPEGTMTGISRKLPDTERARLKSILKKIVPENAGVIVRTAAEGATEEDLTRDVTRLQAQWEEIKKKSKMITTSSPSLLYGEPDMTVRVIRDIFNEDFSKLIVSGDEPWETIHGYVSHVAPDLAKRLSKWTSEVDVFATYRIDEQLMKALDRKVWLPSGGSLVIDRTEAMVVVDVNTGKFTGQGGNLEETVTRNNLEAAEEIVRQLRLRDLGGIIVVDFIDMVLEGNRDLVLRRLMECLGRDRTKHQVAEVTSLGLVQMTRKRVGQGLLEAFSETCERCNGRGVIVHMDAPETKGHGNTANGNGGSTRRKRGKGEKNADRNGHGPITEVVESELVDEAVEFDADVPDAPEIESVEIEPAELDAAAEDAPRVEESAGSVEPAEVAEAIEVADTVEGIEGDVVPPAEAEVVADVLAAEAATVEAALDTDTDIEPVQVVTETVEAAEPTDSTEAATTAEPVEEASPAPAKRTRKAAAKKTTTKKTAAVKTTPVKKAAAKPRKSAKKVAAEAAEAAESAAEGTAEPQAAPVADAAPAAETAQVEAAPAAEESAPAKPAKAAAKPRKTSRRATRPAGPPEGLADGAEPVSATSGS